MNPWELDRISIQGLPWVLQLDAGLEDDEEFCLVKRILGKATVGQWGMSFCDAHSRLMGSWIRKESPWSNRLETICGELPMTAMRRPANGWRKIREACGSILSELFGAGITSGPFAWYWQWLFGRLRWHRGTFWVMMAKVRWWSARAAQHEMHKRCFVHWSSLLLLLNTPVKL